MKANTKKQKPQEEDEDVAFFYSLLPTVRKLTADQKFSFRMHTLQCLQTVKTTPQTESQPLYANVSHTPDSRSLSASSTGSYFSQWSPHEPSTSSLPPDNSQYQNLQ